MSTPLPPHDQPGLGSLINGDLWSRWQSDGVVFPIETLADACGYFRFKPETTSRIFVAGVDAESADDPPQGFMLHLFPDVARAHQAYAKEMSKRHKIGSGGFEPFLCEESCVVGIPYPNDPEIPDLRHIYSPDRFRRTLNELLTDYPTTDWRVQRSLTKLTLLNYKPGRRAVYRIKVKIRRRVGDEKVRVRLHVKVENPKSADRSFENLQQMHASLSPTSDWRVPRPHGQVGHRTLMAAEWVDGTTLRERAGAGAEAAEEFSRVGSALAQFHGTTVPFEHLFSPVEESDRLRQHATDLARLLPDRESEIKALGERLAVEVTRLSLSPSSPIHNDFHLDQVLLSQDRPIIVDLDRAGRGYAATDIGSFLSHLEEEQIDPALGEAFVEGYRQQNGSEVSEDWIRVSEAIATFRRASVPFRTLEPDWPDQMLARLERTERSLEGLSP